MSSWQDCVVILIDLIGTKELAIEGDGQASALMRRFHQRVRVEMAAEASALTRAYVWNDALLLFSLLDERAPSDILRAADRLKQRLDLVAKSYAIAVKGQAFPHEPTSDCELVTVIQGSSYALANCFSIEAQARSRGLHAAWYVDDRIAGAVNEATSTGFCHVRMLPTGKMRKVHLYPSSLWPAMSTERLGDS